MVDVEGVLIASHRSNYVSREQMAKWRLVKFGKENLWRLSYVNHAFDEVFTCDADSCRVGHFLVFKIIN